MQGTAGEEGRDEIVDHHAPPARQSLKLPYAKRLHDVEKPEQDEPAQENGPFRPKPEQSRQSEEAQRHRHEFVEYDTPRIPLTELLFSESTDESGGDTHDRCHSYDFDHAELPKEQEHVQQSSKRAPSAGGR